MNLPEDPLPLNLTEQAIDSVLHERAFQDERWGGNRQLPDDTWLRILVEEVGEVAKALNDREPVEDLRAELVQVAAVAIAWIEAMDTKEAA